MTNKSSRSPILLALTSAVALCSAVALADTVARYVILDNDGEPTVRDDLTGLEWQQVASTDGPLDWKSALAHCEGLSYGGNDDWHLPSVNELSSIVDEKKAEAPAINTTYFVGFEPATGYWTATTSRISGTAAYVVYFNDQNSTVGRGGVSTVSKTANHHPLCVRREGG